MSKSTCAPISPPNATCAAHASDGTLGSVCGTAVISTSACATMEVS